MIGSVKVIILSDVVCGLLLIVLDASPDFKVQQTIGVVPLNEQIFGLFPLRIDSMAKLHSLSSLHFPASLFSKVQSVSSSRKKITGWKKFINKRTSSNLKQ